MTLSGKSSGSIENQVVEWEICKLIEPSAEGITVLGNPSLFDCPYGKAVKFDGKNDAIILDTNPLANLKQFTIEAVVCSNSGGPFEQRFLHFGESQSDRVLLETRVTENGFWYFDAFITTGGSSCVLIDEKKQHPLDNWDHLVFVIDNGKVESYVNGQKELEGEMVLTPLVNGKTSIGVRQNLISWFKGSIYKIKITPKALEPESFMKL